MSAKYKIIFAIVVVQVAFFLSWFYVENSRLHDPQAREILVQVRQFDPRDWISGNYMTLNYDFSWFSPGIGSDPYNSGGVVAYVVLKQDGKYYVKDYITLDKPAVRPDQVVMMGTLTNKIILGIEKFFINEATIQPKFDDKIEVVLVIDAQLKPHIKTVLVNGVSIK